MAQKPEFLRVGRGPACAELQLPGTEFWMQRRSAKNRHSNTRTHAETKICELGGRKSRQKRPIWRRSGNVRFARDGWWRCYERVSATQFPAIRENNREFCEIGVRGAGPANYFHENSKSCRQIPCFAEQGICKQQGILSNGSGNSGLKRELPFLSALSADEPFEGVIEPRPVGLS